MTSQIPLILITHRVTRSLSHGFLAILFFAILSENAGADTFFVSQMGNDSQDGTSWAKSWRTLQRAAEFAQAGDTILIRKGEVPYKGFITSRSGTADKPIVFRGESRNDPPVISGGFLEARWSPSDFDGVWTVPTTAKPLFVVEDDEILLPASSSRCDDGRWFWSDNNLYYKPSSGNPAKHSVWRQAYGGGVGIDNHSWITIQDLSIWLGGGAGITIRGSNAQYNQIKDINVQWHWRGIDITNGASYNTVENCTVQFNMDGVYLSGGASYNTIRNCKAIRNGNPPYWNSSDRAGIAIGGYGINYGNIIEYNEVAYNGGPHSDPGLIAYQSPKSIIRNNHVHHNYGAGLFVTIRSDGSKVSNNLVEYNGLAAVSEGHKGVSGLSIRRSRDVEVTQNTVIGNAVSSDSRWAGKDLGPRGGLELRGLPSDDMQNIKFIGNTVRDTVGGPNIFIHRAPNTAGLLIDHKNEN